jgi:DeoR family transcriptional regulator, aga operon transcriptional repressor
MESATSGTRLLLAQERRNRIVELAQHHAAVRIGDLSKMFEVSDVTIRSDLEVLAKQGYVIRGRGGAVANVRASLSSAFEQRAGRHLEEKQRIGAAAARLVSPSDTIIMDAGSTLMEMAKSLDRVAPLTVITNALNIAMQVGSLPDVNVFVIGGSLNRLSLCTIGLQAEHDLGDLVAQKAFVGIPAISPDAGLTDLSIESARTKRALIAAAQQVILLADSSKWGEIGFAKVIPLTRVNTIVTDTGLPDDARAIIEHQGIELILV